MQGSLLSPLGQRPLPLSLCLSLYIYILAVTRAYPGTAKSIDQGGCGVRCNDETLRILSRMTFRILIRLSLDDLELEPDRSRRLYALLGRPALLDGWLLCAGRGRRVEPGSLGIG